MLSQSPKVMRPKKRNKQKNKCSIARGGKLLGKAAHAMNDFEEAIRKFESLAMMASQSVVMYSSLNNMIQVLPSRIDSFTYKLDQIQRDVMTLENTLRNLQNIQYMSGPIIASISSLQVNVNTEYSNFVKELVQFRGAFNELDKMVQDPVIKKTLDELREISKRYDSILE
jgi:predicted transcriptional regulator